MDYKESESPFLLNFIKLFCMVSLFFSVYIPGNIPFKSTRFRKNTKMLRLTSAFSGGLFIGVGLLHLLTESAEVFIAITQTHVPYSQIICLIAFLLFLFLDKIAFSKVEHDVSDQQSVFEFDIENKSHSKPIPIAPIILSVAIGIHAIFEGVAIGIETHVSDCIGIALAIVSHKWAEGLTLGIAFKKAELTDIQGFNMILLQSSINPIGIILGWFLSAQGELVKAIFVSVSAGTFLYFSTMDIIVEEFTNRKFQNEKYVSYMVGFIFISLIWFLEKAISF